MGSAGPTPKFGTPSLSASSAEGFDRIADYELLEMIGSGGMGRVFRAQQVSLGRIVALKILPPALARNQTYTLRFLREARASGKLTHPNVVQGIDCGQDESSGLWYFAMEYVDGYSLADELKRSRALSEERAIEIGLAIASALEVAAKHGIVHRDIKPENILISHGGEIKLADLGVAKISQDEDASLTRAEDMVGTPYYVPPEQARGKRDQIDSRSDIYALGATLFHLVTGQPPYDGETCTDIMMKHIQDKVPLAHRVDPEISEAFSRVIAKMMQKMPAQRYQTPTELREALERARLGIFVGRGETTCVDPVPRRGTARGAPSRASSARISPLPLQGRSGTYMLCGTVALLVSAALLVLFMAPGQVEKPDVPSADPKSLPPVLPSAFSSAPELPPPAVLPSATAIFDAVVPEKTEPDALRGRFVRVELLGENRVLCLAEVEIFSGGQNVALRGKATQLNTAFGGVASRAIDGRTDGSFSRGSISHTNPSQTPHWEVDLGREYAIERIVVWTRTDENGKYASRLADFSLHLQDNDHAPVCSIEKVPAPSLKCILQPVLEAGKPARLTWSMPPGAPPVAAAVVPPAHPAAGAKLGAPVPDLNGWLWGDVGAVSAAGTVDVNGDTMTLNASGEDIWGQTDEGVFVYRCLRGNGSLTVRVQSIGPTDPWAKVGVMFREDLSGTSRNAFIFAAAGTFRVLTFRANKGAYTLGRPHGPMAPFPAWLRLTREGDAFTGFYSADGKQWTQLGTVTLAMGRDIYACLAASSHLDGAVTTVVVDRFKLEGTPTPADEWPATSPAPAP